MLHKGTMFEGSQGTEEDPIILSLRSEINGLDLNLISKDPKIEACLSDASSASHPVENVLPELTKVIHDSGENCKSSASQSSDNKNATDPQDEGESDFLAKESDKPIEKVNEYLSTCFQQPNGKGKAISAAENIDQNHSWQQPNDKGTAVSAAENICEIHSKLQENSLTTQLRNLPNLSMGSLQRRYNVLGPLLKHCLLFLSVFPEKKFIKKRSLIYWWIGEGWVSPSQRQTAEQVGEECFKMLLLSGLIQPFLKKHDKHARGCVINRSVKKMLISNAANDNFFAFDSQNNPTEKCKRACLMVNKEEDVVEVTLDPKPHNLLSLFNVNAHYLECPKNKLSSLESIVVLQLGRWQSSAADHQIDHHAHHIETEDTKFLENLGVMKNLRYLSLQGMSKIKALPDSCWQLARLQILDLRGCHHLERLPNGIEQLKNLTHLDVSGCPLKRIPKGLSALLELQVLKGFVLANGSCALSELTALKKLKKLSINALALSPNDVIELEHFSSLRSLTIYWAKEVLSPLTFPPDLEKLDLKCIPHIELPDWLRPGNLKKLKKLYIRGGKLKSLKLGTEAGKCDVETLRLRFMKELEGPDWSELEKAFPDLSFMEIYECPKLEENSEFVRHLIREDEVLIMKKHANVMNPVDPPCSK